MLAVGAAVAIVLLFPQSASEQPPLAGTVSTFAVASSPEPAASAAFQNGEGEQMSIESFRGKVVLLNLWATWCAPCVKEMPALDRLQRDLGGETFEVVALSSDREGRTKVAEFMTQHGIDNLAVYLDPGSTATRAFGVRGLPTTLLIDAEGREVGRLEGAAEWDAPEAKDLIRFYMDRDG